MTHASRAVARFGLVAAVSATVTIIAIASVAQWPRALLIAGAIGSAVVTLLAFRARSAAQEAAQAAERERSDLEQRMSVQAAALAEAHAEVQKAHDEARKAKQTTRDFLANVSHEIRTPMNGVLGMLELAMDTKQSAAQREFSQTALASAESLLGMINDILDFSHIDAGRLELHSGDFDLRERLGDVIATLAARGAEKGLSVTLNVDAGVPDRLHGDLGRLRQVIVNLAGNAIRFTNAGRVEVDIGVREQIGDRVTLEVAVKDTGVGIPAEQQQLIFEAFRQGDTSDTRRFDGAGLGLTIAAELVRRMGGEISLESAPGAGSTFRFTAVLTAAQKEPATTAAPQPADVATPARSSQLLRVLVVEDNAVNQKYMRTLLTREGHVVTIAENGSDAVDFAAQSDFDLVLMDVQMPVMGGIEATERIREWERKVGGHVPIIALTARAVDGGREACLAAGMDAYLTKPVRSEDLLATIDEIVRGVTTQARGPSAQASHDEVFDEPELLRTVGGDRALLRELTTLFLADSQRHLGAIRDAVGRDDAPAVKFAAHALAGSAGTVLARSVAREARALEVIAAKNGPVRDASQPLADLEAAMAELRSRLLSNDGG